MEYCTGAFDDGWIRTPAFLPRWCSLPYWVVQHSFPAGAHGQKRPFHWLYSVLAMGKTLPRVGDALLGTCSGAKSQTRSAIGCGSHVSAHPAARRKLSRLQHKEVAEPTDARHVLGLGLKRRSRSFRSPKRTNYARVEVTAYFPTQRP